MEHWHISEWKHVSTAECMGDLYTSFFSDMGSSLHFNDADIARYRLCLVPADCANPMRVIATLEVRMLIPKDRLGQLLNDFAKQ